VTTPPLLRVLRRTIDALDRAGNRYAVLGGFAVRHWGIPRPTYDLDVAVAVGGEGVRPLLAVLDAAGFEIPEEHARGFLDTIAGMSKFTVRRLEAGSLWEVDCFVASTPFLRSALKRTVPVTLQGRTVPILAAEDILLLKVLASRRKDLADAEEILAVVGSLDLVRMRRWADRLGVRGRLERVLREADRA